MKSGKSLIGWPLVLALLAYSSVALAADEQSRPSYTGIGDLPEEIDTAEEYLDSLIEESGGDASFQELINEDEMDSMRLKALRESAVEYGVSAGFYWAAAKYDQYLSKYEDQLDEIFSFRHLLMEDEAGRLIQPAVVSESRREAVISDDGQSLRTVAHHYRILQGERFVLQPPTWRSYLPIYVDKPSRAVEVEPKDEEKQLWQRWVLEGWRAGLKQADRVIKSNMAMLARDRAGMIRYHLLLKKGYISPPDLASRHNPTTGGGEEMAISDSVLRIETPSALTSNPEEWRPIPPLPSFDYLNIDALDGHPRAK